MNTVDLTHIFKSLKLENRWKIVSSHRNSVIQIWSALITFFWPFLVFFSCGVCFFLRWQRLRMLRTRHLEERATNWCIKCFYSLQGSVDTFSCNPKKKQIVTCFSFEFLSGDSDIGQKWSEHVRTCQNDWRQILMLYHKNDHWLVGNLWLIHIDTYYCSIFHMQYNTLYLHYKYSHVYNHNVCSAVSPGWIFGKTCLRFQFEAAAVLWDDRHVLFVQSRVKS